MKEDAVEQQNAPGLCFTDPRTLNMEEYEGMEFNENNYSPILHQSVENHQKESLQDPHQHQNLMMSLS